MEYHMDLISQIARFLRLNGQNIIHGNSKLSLTSSALCVINAMLDVRDCGTVSQLSREFIDDANFLSDFLKKTRSLKLFHGVQTLIGMIDVSQFESLTTLELRKIPAHLICGLNKLTKLQVIICHRSIASLKELFGAYSPDDMWLGIKELNISNNFLEGFDETLGLMQNIEVLDARYNNLKDIDEILMLNKLSVLRVGHNSLLQFPVLNADSSALLKILSVRNNYLEDLSGLERYVNLEELDVSWNCLCECHTLNPLKELKFLKILHLKQNPFTFCKQYKEVAVQYLHQEVVSKGIVIDGKTLCANDMLVLQSFSIKPKLTISSRPASISFQTAINVIVEDADNIHNDQHYDLLQQCTSARREEQNVVMEPDDIFSRNSCSETTDDFLQSKVKTEKKLPKRVREAVIIQPEESCDETVAPLKSNKGCGDSKNMPTHIITKKFLETRRRNFGSEWLLPSHSLNVLISDLTKENTSSNIPLSDDSTSESSAVKHAVDKPDQPALHMGHLHDDGIFEVPSNRANPSSHDQMERKHSIVSDDIEVLDSELSHIESQTILNEPDINISELNIYENYKDVGENGNTLEDYMDSDSEDQEDHIFLLEKKDKENLYPLFISIGKKYLKEKDFHSGKLLDYLDLRCLFSIKQTEYNLDGVIKYEVDISFDMLKVNKQRRTYILDDKKSMKDMVSFLQPFAEEKAFKDTAFGALECVKCNAQFSRAVAHHRDWSKKLCTEKGSASPCDDICKEELILCPNCGSNIIVELDFVPLPCKNQPTKEPYQCCETDAAHS